MAILWGRADAVLWREDYTLRSPLEISHQSFLVSPHLKWRVIQPEKIQWKDSTGTDIPLICGCSELEWVRNFSKCFFPSENAVKPKLLAGKGSLVRSKSGTWTSVSNILGESYTPLCVIYPRSFPASRSLFFLKNIEIFAPVWNRNFYEISNISKGQEKYTLRSHGQAETPLPQQGLEYGPPTSQLICLITELEVTFAALGHSGNSI